MTDGKLVLNGITDPQFQIIVEQVVNGRYMSLVRFDEQQMQTEQGSLIPGTSNQSPVYEGNPIYDNVTLLWDGDDGLNAIAAILGMLTR